MRTDRLTAALVEVLNAPPGPGPPALAFIKYPGRNCNPRQIQTAPPPSPWLFMVGSTNDRGHGLNAAPIDPAAVQAALNAALPDGLSVIAVQDHHTKIIVKIKEEVHYG